MITRGNWNTFLARDDEELLLVRRKHIFIVVTPILFTSLFVAVFIAGAFFVFIKLFFSIPFFITSILLIISCALTVATKTIIDWYYHLYIVTNKKILEVWYTPLASHMVNDVLLDKVNCTEIDLRINGLLHEVLNMGDVVITFDRPTHQEEFVLTDMEDCDKVGKFLTDKLIAHEAKNAMQTIWFRRPSNMLAHA